MAKRLKEKRRKLLITCISLFNRLYSFTLFAKKQKKSQQITTRPSLNSFSPPLLLQPLYQKTKKYQHLNLFLFTSFTPSTSLPKNKKNLNKLQHAQTSTPFHLLSSFNLFAKKTKKYPQNKIRQLPLHL